MPDGLLTARLVPTHGRDHLAAKDKEPARDVLIVADEARTLVAEGSQSTPSVGQPY